MYRGGFYMANYTQNYQLHQWEPTDNFLRTDFNEDHQKIDSAIKNTEQTLRKEYEGEVSRLDSALDNAEQRLQDNLEALEGEVSRLDLALTSTEQNLRTSFQADIQKVNTMLTTLQQTTGQKLEMVSGSFTGTAEVGTMTEQVITLGFQPKAVFTGSTPFHYSADSGYNANCVLIYPGITCSGTTSWEDSELAITENGFRVAGLANFRNIVFQYLALR